MEDTEFWSIIHLLDGQHTGDDNSVIEPAVAKLASLSNDEIFLFDDCLANKLFAIDTRKHARHSTWIPFATYFWLSSDDFLYARCCVVANGESFYSRVLNNPSKFVKGFEFESLLYIASNAFSRKTGHPYEHVTEKSFETYSNKSEWGFL